MQEHKGDINNLFCSYCGGLTPIRSIKQPRSLIAPSIQQTTTVILSNKEANEMKRKPQGVNRKQSDLERYLSQRGRTVLQSDTIGDS
jgi:hypothetical protein